MDYPNVYHRWYAISKELKERGFRIIDDLAPFREVAMLAKNLGLSKEAKMRLKWMDYYQKHQNAQLLARHFGIHVNTFYYWRRRYNPFNLRSLETRSSRPLSSPFKIPQKIRELVCRLKRDYPSYGKEKLEVILQRDHRITISQSSIYRILKEKGLIRIYRKKKRVVLRSNKIGKIKEPGDLVQIDTKHLRLDDHTTYYQFTAVDSFTRMKVAYVYRKANQKSAILFLNWLILKFPFKIKAIQTDNGSEYQSLFDKSCQKLKITHYYTFVRSPEENGKVERAHRTVEEDFYSLGNLTNNLSHLNYLLKQHLKTYNTFRPHKALNNLTPYQYFLTYTKNLNTLQEVLV